MNVDSSVWINHFKKNDNSATQLLAEYLRNDKTVMLCTVTVQEVLQGTKGPAIFEIISELFDDLQKLPCQHYRVHTEAAKMYMNLRKKGTTIRKPNDCLIVFQRWKIIRS